MLSRQRIWQKKQHVLGNCIWCGVKTEKYYCQKHRYHIRNRVKANRILGSQLTSEDIKLKLLARL